MAGQIARTNLLVSRWLGGLYRLKEAALDKRCLLRL